MSTYTSEPGTRLAGRYRLVDQTSAGTGWTYWKAVDETLARSVTVLTFAAGFDRTAETITAARAASRLSDPRFSQVFDVEDADDQAYVVMEWVVGESLLDMLADGPLDSPRAVSLVCEAARALAAAHATGLAHLRLSPTCLHWTRGSGVKITGLGIDAALADPAVTSAEDGENSALTDTRGLASLLYAALTGYWPGPREPSAPETPAEAAGAGEAADAAGSPGPAGPEPVAVLPPAPEADGAPCTPRQVSAGVPANIDALTCQALFQRPSRHGPALSTPAMFADALASVAPPDPLLVPAAATTRIDMPVGRATPPTGPHPAADPTLWNPPGGPTRRPSGRRRSAAAIVVSAVIVLVLAAVGVTGWALAHRGHHPSAAPPTQGPTSSSAPAATSSVVIKPVSANSFDVYGNDGGDEDGSQAKYAIDNNPATFWHTSYYDTYPAFGNLKKGTGLILDMGKQVRLSQVVVQFGSSCCAHVLIEIGNNNDPVPSSLSTFTPVQSTTSASGSTTFNVTSKTTGRYVLIWITYLPPLAGSSGQYEAQIYNVVVHGSAASQSG
jgi:serine/threonine protein kinase